jgi:hypothetical protein
MDSAKPLHRRGVRLARRMLSLNISRQLQKEIGVSADPCYGGGIESTSQPGRNADAKLYWGSGRGAVGIWASWPADG